MGNISTAITSSTSTGNAPARVSASCRTVGAADDKECKSQSCDGYGDSQVAEEPPHTRMLARGIKQKAEDLIFDYARSLPKDRCPWSCVSALQRFGAHDFDTEAAKSNVSASARGEEANRGNAEVLENLRTEADFAPLSRAGRIGSRVAMRISATGTPAVPSANRR